MENNFNNRDFEQFVKQNADQYRMFPSEKVWNGIHNTLHTRRRWYGVGLGLLLLTTGVVTWVMLNTSGKNRQVVSTLPSTLTQQPISSNTNIAEPVVTAKRVNTAKTPFVTPAENLERSIYIFNPDDPAGQNNGEDFADEDFQDIANANLPAAVVSKEVSNPASLNLKSDASPARQVSSPRILNTPAIAVRATNNVFPAETKPVSSNAIDENMPVAAKNTEFNLPRSVDTYPLTIESVINSYSYMPKRKRASVEFYFSPTVSYRELKENKAFINSARETAAAMSPATPVYTYSADVNSAVTHKPDAGLQLGFTAGYPISKKLKFIGGLQFNVSKYDIRAYSHPVELTTISLTTDNGRPSTVFTLTNYRNDGGTKANWLHNLYFSASAPIGLEYKIKGNNKSYIGVSGTVQPSYVISNRAYVISTDYKNYAEVPSLIRKWNINTGFELFAGVTTGKVQWRVGPQVRYQVMSSFIKKYPVQEHLFDFGLKLGVMLKK